jgi:5-methylcytosine-specific restriction enzyme A
MPTLKKATKQKIKSNKKEERKKIYNNTRWRKLRIAKLQQCPLCEVCLAKGVITPAIDVHHIDSFMNYEGLKRLEKAYNFANLLPVCKECHQKIHNG